MFDVGILIEECPSSPRRYERGGLSGVALLIKDISKGIPCNCLIYPPKQSGHGPKTYKKTKWAPPHPPPTCLDYSNFLEPSPYVGGGDMVVQTVHHISATPHPAKHQPGTHSPLIHPRPIVPQCPNKWGVIGGCRYAPHFCGQMVDVIW